MLTKTRIFLVTMVAASSILAALLTASSGAVSTGNPPPGKLIPGATYTFPNGCAIPPGGGFCKPGVGRFTADATGTSIVHWLVKGYTKKPRRCRNGTWVDAFSIAPTDAIPLGSDGSLSYNWSGPPNDRVSIRATAHGQTISGWFLVRHQLEHSGVCSTGPIKFRAVAH
jgi:hypothetical protein